MKKLVSLTLVSLLVLVQLVLPAKTSAATTVSISSPSANASLGSSFTVSGSATPKRWITVKVNGTVAATTTSSNTGSWSVSVTGQTAGAKTIEATASVQYMYTPNSGDNTISVINTVTNEVVNSISTDVPLSAGRVSPNGSILFTYQTLGTGAGSQIRVFSLADPENPSLTNSLTMQATGAFPGMTVPIFSPDSSKFYLSNEDFADGNPSYVSVYDATNFAAAPTNIDALAAGCAVPVGLAQRVNTSIMYVNCGGDSTIKSFNVNTNTFTGTSIDLTGQGGANISGPLNFSPDGSTLYLNWQQGPFMYRINPDTEVVGTRAALVANANGLDINDAGTTALVANAGSNSISVFDLTNFSISQNIAMAGTPYLALYNYDESFIYVTNQSANIVSVLSASNYSLVTTIATGSSPNIPMFAPLITSSASVNVTVSSLADTGQSRQLIQTIALLALVLPAAYLVIRRVVTTSGR